MAKVIREENFAGRFVIDGKDLADEYEDCNFSHRHPLVEGDKVVPVPLKFTDGKSRKFVRCNLTNVRVPAGSVVEGCGRALREDIEVVPDSGEFKARRYGVVDHAKDGVVEYFSEVQERPIEIKSRAVAKFRVIAAEYAKIAPSSIDNDTKPIGEMVKDQLAALDDSVPVDGNGRVISND